MMLWTYQAVCGQWRTAIYLLLLIGHFPFDQAICSAAPHDGHPSEPTAVSSGAKTIGTGLILPNIEGPKPWSDKPALTEPAGTVDASIFA